ncbi:uncharacterized protein SCHCODRAFT_02625397 [Schizophyllum commune H4-8]|uniref:uncharacterized protein n=1 Tax=Schizophyllum commune (strain H4-8 / FGSC 9210) TaxID=578458 RepID=UPI00215FDB00|nr:uncharacterized protein SCHCODRAFT_02625397 [Schizophyllum commune H4-8]KAI5892136.1 hypothetical protein SCHCODRAFT_02625397 [Schizophyllum commune H4-8]
MTRCGSRAGLASRPHVGERGASIFSVPRLPPLMLSLQYLARRCSACTLTSRLRF